MCHVLRGGDISKLTNVQGQIDDYHADSNHVYIIIRIFHANSVRGPQQVFLVDPFVLLRDGTLEVVGEENGGIWVEVASESEYPRLAARL